jgi:hypothetical protein
MARVRLPKKMYRVVEMIDGVPHGISVNSCAKVHMTDHRQALKQLKRVQANYPSRDIQLIETEPLVWVAARPHECTFGDWIQRTKFLFVNGTRTSEDYHWRMCTECEAEEWSDLPPEMVEKAIKGTQQIEQELEDG